MLTTKVTQVLSQNHVNIMLCLFFHQVYQCHVALAFVCHGSSRMYVTVCYLMYASHVMSTYVFMFVCMHVCDIHIKVPILEVCIHTHTHSK